ncbi:hypothetical protein F5Y02DRAFT_429551 [Annulohypoxylon stygium]|nr:hypothetical protein F5Y02DRAFT_429551 [Annulohypoxylon stygium]
MGGNYQYPGGMPPYQQPYSPYQQSYQQQGYQQRPGPPSPRFPQQGENINADGRLRQPASPGRRQTPYIEPFPAYQYNPGGTYLYPPEPQVSYYDTPYEDLYYEDSDSDDETLFYDYDPPPPYKSPLHSPYWPYDDPEAGPQPEPHPEFQEGPHKQRSRSKSRPKKPRRKHHQPEYHTDPEPKSQTHSHSHRHRSQSRHRSTHEPSTPERRHRRSSSQSTNLRPLLHRTISQEQLRPILKPSPTSSPQVSPLPSPRKSRSGSQTESKTDREREHKHKTKHHHRSHSSSHHSSTHHHRSRRYSMSVPNPSSPLAPSFYTEQDILDRARAELAPLTRTIRDIVTYEFALPSSATADVHVSFSLSPIDLDPPSPDLPTTWSLRPGILRSLTHTRVLAPLITISLPAAPTPRSPRLPTHSEPDHGVIAASERVIAALRYGSTTPYPTSYLPLQNPYPANPFSPQPQTQGPPSPAPGLPFRAGGELGGSNYVFRYGAADRNTVLCEATWVYLPVAEREGLFERFERVPRDGGRALRRWARGWGIEEEVGGMFGR